MSTISLGWRIPKQRWNAKEKNRQPHRGGTFQVPSPSYLKKIAWDQYFSPAAEFLAWLWETAATIVQTLPPSTNHVARQ
jgi:hypothetical protein